MLGVDALTQERWQREAAKQRAIDLRQRALAEDLQSSTLSVEDDGEHDSSNLLTQLGKPLTAQQVIEKLKKCNSKLYFELSKHNLYGIYLLDHKGKVHVTPEGDVVNITHICGMESGIMPEFTVLHKRKKLVPNEELFGNKTPTRDVQWKEIETYSDQTRGWRTVLVRLLHAGLINRSDVEKHFGWTPSRDSKKWFDRTR